MRSQKKKKKIVAWGEVTDVNPETSVYLIRETQHTYTHIPTHTINKRRESFLLEIVMFTSIG